MNAVEVLSKHFDTVLINPILKGNNKCTYYPIQNGLEVQEILSQSTLLRLWRTLHVQRSSKHIITRASQQIKGTFQYMETSLEGLNPLSGGLHRRA